MFEALYKQKLPPISRPSRYNVAELLMEKFDSATDLEPVKLTSARYHQLSPLSQHRTMPTICLAPFFVG